MPPADDHRALDQELASGQSEKTPVIALSAVIGVVAAFVAVALILAVVAYVLA